MTASVLLYSVRKYPASPWYQAADETEFLARGRLLDFLRCRSVLLEPLDDGIGRGLETRQVVTRSRGNHEIELADILAGRLPGLDRRGRLLVVDERVGDPRGARAGEDGGEHVEGEAIVVGFTDRRPVPRGVLPRRKKKATRDMFGRLVIGFPREMSPKYLVTHSLARAGSKSPTIATYALFGA